MSRFVRTVKNKRKLRISTANKDALNALGKLSKKYGFDIYLTHGSLYRKLRNHKSFKSFYDKQLKNIEAIARRYPRFHVIPTILDYPKEDMEATVDHVHPEVAPRFTSDLAHMVQRYLDGKSSGKPKGQRSGQSRFHSPPRPSTH